MGKALYRQYRPKKLSEIVGQDHITTTLKNALKKGSISHAYLLTGPKGVGKTSVARILAHEVNNLDYEADQTHLDIIEIDAASNRRIDEIRSLRERVHNAPTSAKYKVYIIDEVHMLTKEAFNALLKTLEEPPAHAIFILATTEAHKLPATIVSRTQRFTFKPIESAVLEEHLRQIAESEKIKVAKEALELIAAHGDGSFRDSISLLDQAASRGDKIELDDVQAMLGRAPVEALDNLLTVLQQGTPSQLVDLLIDLRAQGYQAAQLAKQLADQLRQRLLDGTAALPPVATRQLLKELIEVPASHDPDSYLEISLLGVMLAHPSAEKVEPAPKDTPKKESAKAVVNNQKPLASKASKVRLDDESWQTVLAAIKQQHNTLYSIVRMAEPQFEDGRLTLSFGFSFHQKRLNEAKNRQLLADILHQIVGEDIVIASAVDPAKRHGLSTPKPEVKASGTQQLDAISNIFGGAEVLE